MSILIIEHYVSIIMNHQVKRSFLATVLPGLGAPMRLMRTVIKDEISVFLTG